MARNVERPVLSDEFFLEALAWAKAHARALGEAELTPRRLADGFVRVLDLGSMNMPQQIRDRIDALRSPSDGGARSLPRSARPIRRKVFPLSGELREIIARRTASVVDLLDALQEKLSRSAQPELPAFADIVRTGSRLAIQRGEAEISAEAFASAAYLVCLGGALDDDAPLASYLVSNRDACAALLKKFVPDGFVPTGVPGPENAVPLSKSLQDALAETGEARARLRRAINLGLATGVQLVTEESTAYHEAGHAVVAAVLLPTITVAKVTIEPDEKEGSAGYMALDDTSAFWRRDETQETVAARLAVLLAGRMSELIKYGRTHVSTGATSDISKATGLAWRCVAEEGLDAEVGPISISVISEKTGQAGGWLFDFVQRRVHQLLKDAADRAESILRANWIAIEKVTTELLLHKTLNDTSFMASLLRRGLDGTAGVLRAMSRPVRRHVSFAVSPGAIETLEGPVRYRTGDGIVTGAAGERWPVSRSYLEKFYDPVDNVTMGTDGVYEKRSRPVLALKLAEKSRVDLQGAMGILSGNAGDWVVDYGEGDLAVVGEDRFSEIYEIFE